MAISQLILACEVMYTSTPAVAVELCLVLVAHGCMQKFCKRGGGGGRTCEFKKKGAQLCKQRHGEHWKTMFKKIS